MKHPKKSLFAIDQALKLGKVSEAEKLLNPVYVARNTPEQAWEKYLKTIHIHDERIELWLSYNKRGGSEADKFLRGLIEKAFLAGAKSQEGK